jgi:uncharacterized protein (DUF849 family)
MEPLIIEVAVNGATGRQEHARVPLTPDEIVADARACAAAGAAVIHVHGRGADGSFAFDDADAYRPVFAELRGKDGLVVYPTMFGSRGHPLARWAHVDTLDDAKLIDWAPLDPGATNLVGARNGRLAEHGFTYANPIEETRYMLGLCERRGLAASVALYEPHFIRHLLLLLPEFPRLRPPIMRFMFGGARLPFGFPPATQFVDAYLALLESHPGLPWMVACLGGDVLPIAEHVIRRGGHIRVGLEDDASDPARGNVERVREVAELARAAGRAVATPAEARAISGAA